MIKLQHVVNFCLVLFALYCACMINLFLVLPDTLRLHHLDEVDKVTPDPHRRGLHIDKLIPLTDRSASPHSGFNISPSTTSVISCLDPKIVPLRAKSPRRRCSSFLRPPSTPSHSTLNYSDSSSYQVEDTIPATALSCIASEKYGAFHYHRKKSLVGTSQRWGKLSNISLLRRSTS